MGETQKALLEKNLRILKKHYGALNDSKKDVKVKEGMEGKLPKDRESCKKRMADVKMRLEKHIANMAIKEDNKTVSLGTSKVNYMDPRITVAWCKKVDLAIEKAFPLTTRTKFPWAMHFTSQYAFD